MADKEPVLLTVIVETGPLRWRVGGIGMDHQSVPLLVSHNNDLRGYESLEFDEQVSFLRHRFCGILQRGCDRLWGVQKKPVQFVFLLDADFPQAVPELTDRVASHLFEWMARPPVTFLVSQQPSLTEQPLLTRTIAGELSAEHEAAFIAGLPALLEAASDATAWELVPLRKSASEAS